MSQVELHRPTGVQEVSTTATRSLVIPVSSEAPWAWTAHVSDLLDRGWDEVVVCSVVPDWETWEALSRLTSRERVKIALGGTRRGAIEEGLAAATGDLVGYVATDRPMPVEELERVSRPVQDHVTDLAVGVVDGDSDDGSPLRGKLDAWVDRFRRRVAGVPVSSLHPDVIVFTRDAWESIGGTVGEREVALETELVAHAHRNGCSIVEQPVEGADAAWPTHRRSETAEPLSTLIRFRRRLNDRRRRPSDEGTVRVGLVSCYPPHHGHLSEYGQNLAAAYGRRDDVELTVISSDHDEVPRFDITGDRVVKRVWRRDSLRGALAILSEVRGGDYDVVHFNVQMTYFGDRNAYRFLGLALPALANVLTDATVMATMHDFLEVADEDAIGEEVSALERLGAVVATQLVLLCGLATVTSQSYVDLLSDRYYAPAIEHVPHGTFDSADPAAMVLDGPFRILVFGHLDPSKKDVETVIEALERVRGVVPDAELWIAGDSHPGYPGYRERLEDRYADRPGVRFTGYVAEDELDTVWVPASVVVLPYRTCTGVSGVFQLAKTYATPVVAYDVDGIRDSTVDTGGEASFVPPGEPEALAEEVAALGKDRQRRLRMARANAEAAGELTIGDSVDRLLELVDEGASGR